VLEGGDDGAPADPAAYGAALQLLDDEPEVALLALPDLYRDLSDAQALPLLAAWLARIDGALDRLLLVDAPRDTARPTASLRSAGLLAWLDQLREVPHSRESRSAAAYHPWLLVPDPLGGLANPLRGVPPSGHVAGVISRLDRERGPHHTPANAPLHDAVDLADRLNAEEQRQLMDGAVNVLRCRAGDGLQVWGGSTLVRVPSAHPAHEVFAPNEFVAYRRLIHRLVRAIRRVAEPLVFDTNGPALWLAFVRAVTTVLLEAWRGGALQGSRPEEAFVVRCDEKTNPPQERELGRCVCEVALAPVAPMEFIVFRVALGGEGVLEVFES
jgi:phage tail sheath protein FI